MRKKIAYLILTIAFFSFHKGYSQDDIKIKSDTIVKVSREFNPLSPSKAAFFSAVLPGLGQAYNRKYWKIPIVYAALGTGIYFYKWNNDNYHKIRDAYKLRLSGKPDPYDGLEGNPYLSEDALVSAQKSYKQDRDLSLLITIGLYGLQIIEASVNAHLLQHNIDDNLSFRPELIKNKVTNKNIVGASFKYKF